MKRCSDAIIGLESFAHFMLRKHPKVLIAVAIIITGATVGSCPPSVKMTRKDYAHDHQYDVLYIFGTAATIVSFLGVVAWLFCLPHTSGSSSDLACA